MSVITNVPKWQIELWGDIFEKMRGPYDSWQATLNLPYEFSCSETKREKWKISLTENWIRLHCPLYKKNLKNLNFEKISQKGLEAIAQTAIMNEYKTTLSFMRFFEKSPFEELSPKRGRCSSTANEQQVPCCKLQDSSANSAVNGRDCARAAVQETEADAKMEKCDQKSEFETETLERIRILKLWCKKPSLYLKTDYSAARRMQDSPVPMVQGSR